ncbi:MAG: glycogen debranching enzyme N-terminal domain-containing protein [Deltaproteobacteria bacterium]|nr:glycogen debranching enzyme N-terminal domain-containing protein [Deltaproteobacteria bacterium]
MIRIDFREIRLPDDDREWLETDGRGGYASSTLENRHTRRYHGLLVANLRTPEGRHVLLSKLEDSVQAGGEEQFFSSHRYPGVLFPPDPPVLEEFLLDTCPRFISQIGRTTVKKSILMPRGKGILLVRYDLNRCPKGGILRLKPFLAFRGYHKLAHKNPFLRDRAEGIENGFRIEPYEGMPPLYIQTSRASRFTPLPVWYNRFQYTEERERGFDWEEDLFLPGILEVPVERKCTVILSVCYGDTMPHHVPNPAAIWQTETVRRGREQTTDQRQAGGFAGEDREFFLTLLRAGRSFLITTPSGRPGIIAGYPWFGSWGRDALISLPGLCFSTGRIAEGIEILTEIGRHEREGLLPNFFSADGAPEAYNTVDSSLWYVWAAQELLRVTGDKALIRDRFWPVMKRIIRPFMDGTRFGIGTDARGLLHAGDGLTAMTWMDATMGGIPVTPRHGCPVEINALWYNALCFTRDLEAEFGEPASSGGDLIPLLRRSFRETFSNWGHDAASLPQGGLGDVFRGGVLDTAVRPNQIFAVSLPFSPLDPAEQAAVVRTVREQLLTPCGLRTLSPADPAYRGRYRGSPALRDGAYHQGTVWPWLLGAFGEAALRVAENPEREKENLRQYLRTFLRQHLSEAGIGSVSEVFDGDAPHRPGGCIAQAWSVAELIRLYTLLGK